MAILSVRRNGVSHFYHHDGLGSTVQLTDANQNVTDSYVYRAFGEEQAVSGTTANPLRFVGNQNYHTDVQSGLVLIGRSAYVTAIGRFVSPNRWNNENHDGNGFLYAKNNATQKAKVAPKQKAKFADVPTDSKDCISKAVGGNISFGKTKEEREKWKKIVRCIIYAESKDDPSKKNPNSSARGLMQILKCHDSDCTKLLKHPFDPYDACDSIQCGAMVLAGCVKKQGGSEIDPQKCDKVYTVIGNADYNKCMKDYTW